MTDSNTQFEMLREILNRPASVRVWQDLVSHLTSWSDGDDKVMALEYASSHLEDWDDRLRQGPLSLWWPTFPKGKPRPEWSLVRALRLDEPHIYMTPKESARPVVEAVTQIRSFQLSPHSASAEQYIRFVEGLGLTSLRALHMDNHQFGPEALRVLLGRPWVRSLTRLDMSFNGIGDVGMQYLLDLCAEGDVSWLDLSANELSDTALDALCHSPMFANLTDVNLGFNSLSYEVLERFVDALSPGQLRSLRIEGISLSARHPERPFVLAHQSLSGLQSLSVSRCQMGDAGVLALAESPFMSELNTLEVAANRLTHKGAEALANARSLRQLLHLDLSHNPIGHMGLQAITRSPYLQRVAQLQLKGVKL